MSDLTDKQAKYAAGREVARGEPRYPSNVLEGFGSGALLDLRVRLAADFLKHSPIFSGLQSPIFGPGVSVIAACALDLADELLKQGAERGWVEPLPDDAGELPPELRQQARRTASYQAQQQLDANRYAQDEAGRVVATQMPAGRPNGRAN